MAAAKCVLKKVLLIPQSLEVLHRTGLRNFDFCHQNFTLKSIQGNEHSFLAYFWKIQHLVNISSLAWARSWPAQRAPCVSGEILAGAFLHQQCSRLSIHFLNAEIVVCSSSFRGKSKILIPVLVTLLWCVFLQFFCTLISMYNVYKSMFMCTQRNIPVFLRICDLYLVHFH